MQVTEKPREDRPATAPPSTNLPPRHDARRLTDGGRAAEIALDGKTYTLRITRAGKLILTK
jgi:hemin uptake protein HemP